MSLPATQMMPVSGSSSLVRRRRKVDFPDPDGPTRKTNSPLEMSTEASRSATVVPLYDLVTFSSLIMIGKERGPRQVGAQWPVRLPASYFAERGRESCSGLSPLCRLGPSGGYCA